MIPDAHDEHAEFSAERNVNEPGKAVSPAGGGA